MTKYQIITDIKEKMIEFSNEGYEYLLAVSTDTLLVISKDQQERIDTIIEGIDINGYVLSCPDEDSFLDAISIIKEDIISGNNPLELLEGCC
jgi:hypothetical protein